MKQIIYILVSTVSLSVQVFGAAPAVLSVRPTAGGIVSNLTQATVFFTTSVNGPAAEDFLINGNPAAAVVGGSNTWTFSFSQPAPGTVAFSWDGSHAIYDLAGNRFDELAPGSTFSVTLMDTIPPSVLSIAPTPGAELRALSQVAVVFKETVTGVDAADLLVGGQPATTVVGSGVGPYVFSFAAPSGPNVTLSWAEGAGIGDTAAPANLFAGGSWDYTLNPALVTDVIINEIMADNVDGVRDEDGDASDWLELYNRGAAPVNLLGWSLSDDPTQPGQWVLPAITLAPGQYLLVFASGKDRAPGETGTNHANFTLAPSEYLGLYDASYPRQVVSDFAPVYPEQRGDIAWGRTGGASAYLATPTPRFANSTGVSYQGFADRPHASVDSGLFAQPFQVSLSSTTLGAKLYYTLNGDVPSPNTGLLYTSPIRIESGPGRGAIPLRAVAYKDGLLPSTVLTRTYIFPDQVLQQPVTPPGFPSSWISGNGKVTTPGDYEMDPQVLTNGTNRVIARQGLTELPVVSLVASVNTFFAPTTGVYTARIKQGNQKAVNVEMWRPNGQQVFQADCGFEIQGGSSPSDSGSDWKDKKLSMRLVFKGDFGTTKLEGRVFDDTPVEEFNTLILDAGLNYWWTHMTDADQRNRAKFITDQFTSDLMNNAGMVAQHGRYIHLYLNGIYWGLYNLHERMDEAAAASYLGGDKEEWDVLKHTGDVAGLQNGTLTAYTDMMRAASAGVTTNLAAYERLQELLDLPWFADYLIVNFYVGNTDWPNHNWYAWHRTRAPNPLPWRFVSWDAEHTVKSYVENRLGISDPNSPGQLFQILRNNLEFKVLFGDRVHHLMYNGGALYSLPNRAAFWSPTNGASNIPASTYRKRVDEIWNSVVCESARWGDVATANANAPYTREVHYTRELNSLYMITNASGQTPNYFPLRGSNVLAQFRSAGLYPAVAAPAFSQHGGRVAPGYNLWLTNLHGSGTLYYTLNGTDPRSYGSGLPAPGVLGYAGAPVVLDRSLTVKARTLVGTNWSALNEASFTAGTLGVPLRITELNYAPTPGPAPGSAYEFLELFNAGPTDLALGGYSFQGISFAFAPSYVLAAGARIVLASDVNPAAFAARYPGVPVAGYFGGALNNTGERIAVLDPQGNIVVSVDYSAANGWPGPAAGGGYSLELIDPNGNPDDPANWRASSTLNGSPGLPSASQPPPDIQINEVMADNVSAFNHAGTFPDWLELYNAGASAVNLTGWSLSDNGEPRRFVFTSGPVLAPGAYLVVFFDTNATPGLHTGFGLDKDGSGIQLYGPATNRVDALTFGAQLANYSIGRAGGVWQLNTPTPGAANAAAPTAGANGLVLNEWLANAIPGGTDWIELHNRSAQPAALQGIYLGTGDVIFRYTSLSFIAPGGFLQLLADENPGVRHLDFKLAAGGGDIALYDPAGNELQRIQYKPQAEGVSEGRLPNGTGQVVAFPGSSSPGAPNYLLDLSGPVLNEFVAWNRTGAVSPWGTRADWVEIANTSSEEFDLGGVSLSDQAGNERWTFPVGSLLPANGYLLVWCDGETAASREASPNLNTGFGLSAKSGALYLAAGNGALIDTVHYGFQVSDLSLGRSQGAWHLLAQPTPGAANGSAVALGNVSTLRFNEWKTAGVSGNDWFELYNNGALPVALEGLYLTDDPSLYATTKFQVGALSFVGARGYAVFEADGDPSQGQHHVNFRLDAGGDALRLYDQAQTLLDAVDITPQEPGASAGRLPDGSSVVSSFPDSPTPGESNYRPLPNAVINEVLVANIAPFEDAIEIYNPAGNGIMLDGWFLSDDATDLTKYRIPNGTFLAAGGYLTLYRSQFGAGPRAFQLDPNGGQLLLSETDAAGSLSGYRAVTRFGATPDGAPLGRIETCTGTDFGPLVAQTFGIRNPSSIAQFRTGAGLFNSEPQPGPVVMSELMYHPSGVSAADNSQDEFIELQNVSGTAVPLYDPARPANTWRLREGVQFTFPPGVSVPAGGFVLVVNFDPTANPAQLSAFRALYNVPTTPIYGPYSGKLDNTGETIELVRPGPPSAQSGLVPYWSADKLTYAASAPWPEEADGTGASLQRQSGLEFGNDAANWVAAAPTAGRANPASPLRPPSIVLPPLSRTVLLGSRVVLSASVCGSRPLSYQWKRNGTALAGATESALVLESVQAGDLGSYVVEIQNAAGNASSAATLAVGTLPVLTAQPQSQSVGAGATVTFRVETSGPGPIRYQWRHDGQPLAGATNGMLVLTNVGLNEAGGYSALVANEVGAVASAVGNLIVLVPPTFTVQPQSQSVSSNGTAVLTVAATGVGPVRYQWSFKGAPLDGATNTSLVLNNAQLVNEGDYRVVAADNIASGFSQVARLTVRVAPFNLVAPIGLTNVVGSTMTFHVSANGSVPMAFRWLRISTGLVTNILYTTSDSLTITNAQTSNSGQYRLIITNSGNLSPGVVLVFNVLVVAPPVITIQPFSQTVNAGDTVLFTPGVSGTGPLAYQWWLSGAPLAGETNATLLLPNVQTIHQGNYQLVVTNLAGRAVSALATLSVNGPPSFQRPQRMPDASVRLGLAGIPNHTYVIETSLDLKNWSPLLPSFVYTNGIMTFSDPGAAGAPSKFYRAREE